MADNITTDDITPDILHALEDFMAAMTENNKALADGLAEIAASVTGPKAGA